jgi:hypothetical protein
MVAYFVECFFKIKVPYITSVFKLSQARVQVSICDAVLVRDETVLGRSNEGVCC